MLGCCQLAAHPLPRPLTAVFDTRELADVAGVKLDEEGVAALTLITPDGRCGAWLGCAARLLRRRQACLWLLASRPTAPLCHLPSPPCRRHDHELAFENDTTVHLRPLPNRRSERVLHALTAVARLRFLPAGPGAASATSADIPLQTAVAAALAAVGQQWAAVGAGIDEDNDGNEDEEGPSGSSRHRASRPSWFEPESRQPAPAFNEQLQRLEQAVEAYEQHLPPPRQQQPIAPELLDELLNNGDLDAIDAARPQPHAGGEGRRTQHWVPFAVQRGAAQACLRAGSTTIQYAEWVGRAAACPSRAGRPSRAGYATAGASSLWRSTRAASRARRCTPAIGSSPARSGRSA